MKTRGLKGWLTAAFLLFGGAAAFSQEYKAEVPGDHFSLEGALELFKKSSSPEDFEKMLNSPDSKVNNLDLNADGYVDYVRVIDRNEGNVHIFILQAMVSERESQDVAVISLEKQSNGKAVLQITGDADVYGVETIIEPTSEVRTYAGTTSARTVVNVWTWPSVRYIYGPRYAGWVSPWRWHYRPVWWSPWRPVVYYDYYSYWRPYWSYYSPCRTHRVVYVTNIYRPYRTTSVYVHNRYDRQITRYRNTYRDDYRHGRTRFDDARYTSRERDGRERIESTTQRQRTMIDRFDNRSSSDSRSTRTDVQRRMRQPEFSAPERSSGSRSVPNVQERSSDRTSDFSRMRSTSPDNTRTYRQSQGSSNLNQRSNVQPERFSVPDRRPTMQRTQEAPQRSSSSMRSSQLPANRSGSINRSDSRPQMSRPAPSVNRSQPSGRSVPRTNPDATKALEKAKRGSR